MAEKFYFDFFQIPHTGVEEPDLDVARTDTGIPIRRAADMKISNFGALQIGARLADDYTRTNTMAFKAKGESEDVNVITEDTGMGQNVRLFGVTVNHNPYLLGSSIKLKRDDQFIRMTMSKESGAEFDPPKFDVMDSKERTAEGMALVANASIKNWPSEGWRSLGGKYDFLPYQG